MARHISDGRHILPNAVDHNHAMATSSDGGASWNPARLLPIQSPYCEGSIASAGFDVASDRVFLSTPSTRKKAQRISSIITLTQ